MTPPIDTTEVLDAVDAIVEEDEEEEVDKDVVVVAIVVLFDQLAVTLIGICSSRCALSEIAL